MAIKTFSSGEVLSAADTNTYLTNSGLVYITSATATSGGTLSINNCFTSTYARYRVIGVLGGSTATAYEIVLRLRAAGVDTATGYYWGLSRVTIATATLNALAGNNATYFHSGAIADNSGRAHFIFDIVNPQVSGLHTTMTGQATDTRSASAYGAISVGGGLSNGTQYDGFTVGYGVFGTGTISNLQVAVYGYRQA